MRWGAFPCTTYQDDACGSISDAYQSDLFFPVHSSLCLFLCKRCNQANGKQDGFVKGLDERCPYVFRVPPPSSGSAQICVHTCNCLSPLIHHLALEGPDHICGDILPNQLQFGREERVTIIFLLAFNMKLMVLLRALPPKNALVLLPLEPRFHFLKITL